MGKRHRFTALNAIAFGLLLCVSHAAGQSPIIRVSHILAPVNQLSVSDIDFRHSTTPKWLFTININVAGVPSLWVKMSVAASFSLSNDGSYTNALTFTTDSFLVTGSRSVSNLDLDRTIGLESYNVDNAARRQLEQTSLSGGQVPSGTYTFNVDVYPAAGGSHTSTAFTIVLTNPTTLELISPIDGDQFVTPFPLFQWLYDGPRSRISIYEKLPGQSTLEEAVSGIPHYSTVTTSNSLQYPSTGARLLQPGKTYVWYVEGLSNASGGTTIGRKSAPRSFTVSSNGAQSLSSILDDLARALPQYQSLFDELKSQGFTTAGTLQLNGATISVSDLQRLLNKLRTNPDAVTSVELE
jgi:hypothetical protein